MRFGIFCLLAGATSLVATIWMTVNGTVFIHGFAVFLALSLFGLYLIRRVQRLGDVKQWAREHPEEAKQWLNAFEEADNNAEK